MMRGREDPATHPPDPDAIVEARGIHRTYPRGREAVHALRGVDIRIRRGEFLVVNGPSGSGKSTLAHVIGGLDRPDEGEVWLDGTPMSGMSDRALTLYRRRRLGFVFQFFHLLPTLSAVENVAVPLLLDRAVDALTKAERALDVVGLADRAAHRPSELSGGEQQRVAVARALVIEPSLVVADEPTGNLDSRAGESIIALLTQVTEMGHTVMLVTHDERWIARADRVEALVDGRLRPTAGEEPFGV